MRRRNPPPVADFDDVVGRIDTILRKVFPSAQVQRTIRRHGTESCVWRTDVRWSVRGPQASGITFSVVGKDGYGPRYWFFLGITDYDEVYDVSIDSEAEATADEIAADVELRLTELRDMGLLLSPGSPGSSSPIGGGMRRFRWNPHGRTRAMTYTNISVLRRALATSPDGVIRRVSRPDVPHLRRAIDLGWLEEVPGERDAWRLSARGREGLES